MAKKIDQIYIDSSCLPFDPTVNTAPIWSDNLLKGPAITLSICGMPGAKFSIADNKTDYSFILGNTGLFTINLEPSYINHLYVHQDTVMALHENAHYIIIDYIYIAEEV